MVADDFASSDAVGPGKGSIPDGKAMQQGQKRVWLKVFETLPPQMLNAYGPAKFAKMADPDVWKHLATPLKSGAMYMTELVSADPERRGVGLNRWLHAMKLFCEYQQEAGHRKQNEALLEPKKCSE